MKTFKELKEEVLLESSLPSGKYFKIGHGQKEWTYWIYTLPMGYCLGWIDSPNNNTGAVYDLTADWIRGDAKIKEINEKEVPPKIMNKFEEARKRKNIEEQVDVGNKMFRDISPDDVRKKFPENTWRDVAKFNKNIETAKKYGKNVFVNVYTDKKGVKIVVDIGMEAGEEL